MVKIGDRIRIVKYCYFRGKVGIVIEVNNENNFWVGLENGNLLSLKKSFGDQYEIIKEESMKNYLMIDGKKIELSEETVKNFKKELRLQPKFKLKKSIPNNLVVHTMEEEESKKLLEVLNVLGYRWSNDHKLTSHTYYYLFKEHSCYIIGKDKTIVYTSYNHSYNSKKNVITFHQFMEEYVEGVE